MLKAIDENNDVVHAFEAHRNSGKFTCRICKENVTFVDADLICKHFRHKPHSDCIGFTSDSAEHDVEVMRIKNLIQSLGIGYVEEEYILDGKFVVDVLWQRPSTLNLAIEVQASQYSSKDYEDKVVYYRNAGLQILYLFMPGNFRNADKDRPYILRLKSFERALLFDHSYGRYVGAAYLHNVNSFRTIEMPKLTEKFAKGTGGLCTETFLLDSKQTKRIADNVFWSKLCESDRVGSVFTSIVRAKTPAPMSCKHTTKVVYFRDNPKNKWAIKCTVCDEPKGWLDKRTIQEWHLDNLTESKCREFLRIIE